MPDRETSTPLIPRPSQGDGLTMMIDPGTADLVLR